jgi:hypothetical protein
MSVVPRKCTCELVKDGICPIHGGGFGGDMCRHGFLMERCPDCRPTEPPAPLSDDADRTFLAEEFLKRIARRYEKCNLNIYPDMPTMTPVEAVLRCAQEEGFKLVQQLPERQAAASQPARDTRCGKPIDGHEECSDCGRAVVWQYAYQGGAWMCPNCVMRRCQDAEEKLRYALAHPERKEANDEEKSGV